MMKPVLTILLLWLMCSGFAQGNPASLRFHFMGVKDGLPEGSVNTLLQDKYGYIWIGTQDGLVRYDGYQPKVYNLPLRDDINNNVKHIFEDRKGRLWVSAYSNNLFYYDRSRDVFNSYLPGVPQQEADDDYAIDNITDDSKGNLWLVLVNLTKRYNTLLSFNSGAHTFQRYGSHEKGSHYIPDDNVLSLILTGNGTLLAGGSGGLYRYDDAHDRFINCNASPDSLSQEHIVLLAADKANRDEVWLAAVNKKSGKVLYDNLIRYNTKTGTLYSYHDQSVTGNSISAVYCAKDDSVWIACDAGLVSFNRNNNRFTNYLPRDIKDKNSFRAEVKDIRADGNGNLWCATRDGLLLFHTTTKQFERCTYDLKSNNGIVDNNIRSFMVDNTGTVWFGAAQLGLQWANTSRSKYTQYQSNPGLQHYFPGGAVNEVAETEDGTTWLSTDIGLYRWQPGTDSFTRIRLGGHGDDDYYSTSVIADKDGWVWSRATATNVGIEGLYGYNPKIKQVVNYRNREGDSTSLSGNTIRALCQDHTGAIWVGTFGGGICRLDKTTGRFTRYPFIKNSGLVISTQAIQKGVLDDDEVQSIYEDETGTLWAGTNNGGLNRLDRTTNRFVPYQKPIANMHCVLSILSAGNGKLWGGTYSNDVYLVDTKQDTYTSLSEATGLLYNGGWGMQYDAAGNLWLSSPRGLSIINNNKKVQNLTVAGGLPAEPLNFFIYRNQRGNFIYGTSDGFVLFNPADVLTKPLPPPVVHIESIAFADENNRQLHDSVLFVFDKKEIQLVYDENRITISYVGLQYQNVSLTKYQYRLEGYDKSWIDGGTQRQVTYTNLSPGSYTFRVKAVNSDGVQSKTIDSIRIIISPPWWQTWWAYMLYVVALGLGVWLFIAYRSKQLVTQNKLLEEKVTERTQQLNQSLTELKTTQSQLVQSEKMASLGELTAGIAHEIQNPLNFVNNFSEINKELIDELQEELTGENYEEVKLIAKDLADNEEKIAYHGKRADAIVKNMLQHSRKSNGQKELANINALCDEYLRLSYHGMRTKDKAFNAQLHTDFDNRMGNIPVVPQDLGRVLLNLFNNAFYAVNEKRKLIAVSHQPSAMSYEPRVSVVTKRLADVVEIVVSDNGNGIPATVIHKVFQPFFTTKPTGEGTGLGLSLSYDIITKEHGGTIEAESKEGEGTRFVIRLPVKANQ